MRDMQHTVGSCGQSGSLNLLLPYVSELVMQRTSSLSLRAEITLRDHHIGGFPGLYSCVVGYTALLFPFAKKFFFLPMTALKIHMPIVTTLIPSLCNMIVHSLRVAV